MSQKPRHEGEKLYGKEGDSWLVKLGTNLGMVLGFVAVLWVANRCTGAGNSLFPTKKRPPTFQEQARMDFLDQLAQMDPSEQERLGEWERSQGRIAEGVKQGGRLMEVVSEEVNRSLASADSFLELLQVSGFWPYLTLEERSLVREGKLTDLPGESPQEFMAVLRVRRFKGVGLWSFMSKDHQEFVGSSQFDQLSESEQLVWAEEMLVQCMENGWSPAEDE